MNALETPVAETLSQLREGKLAGVVTPTTIKSGGLAVFQISGSDAAQFIQNRTTQDIKPLVPGTGCANALINKNAHIQAIFSLHCLATIPQPQYLVLCHTAHQGAFSNALLQYKVIEDITVSGNCDDWEVTLLLGQPWNALSPSAPSAYGISPLQTNGLSLDGWLVGSLPVLLGEGMVPALTLVTPKVSTSNALAQLQEQLKRQQDNPPVHLLDADDWQILAYESGLVLPGIDYDEQTMLPQTGLESLTVSYDKGCFLGQETVAKIRTYGSVPKALTSLLLGAEKPAIPEAIDQTTVSTEAGGLLFAPVVQDGKTVGQVQTPVYSPTLQQWVARAYLDRAARAHGQQLQLMLAAQGEEPCHESFTAKVAPLTLVHTERQNKALAKQLHEKATQILVNGDEYGSLQYFEQALQLVPDFEPALESYGVVLNRLERFEDAIEVFERWLTVNPKAAMAYTNQSIAYMKLGDKDKAEDAKAKATTLSFQLSIAAQMTQSSQSTEPTTPQELAIEKIEEPATVEPSSTSQSTPSSSPPQPSQSQLSQTERQQLKDRAALFEQALSFSPNDPMAHYGLANCYFSLQDYELAAGAFEKTLTLQPKHSQAHLNLGECYEKLGQPEKAMAIYQKGIAIASERGDKMPLDKMVDKVETLKALH